MNKEKDLLDEIEREPWKIERKHVLWDVTGYCIAERQVVGPYYLLRSECKNCPLNDRCNNVTANGWLFLDNLPDCKHDMCCYEGSSSRGVSILEDKTTGRKALSGNYHEVYDFCRFIMGLPEDFDVSNLTPEQNEMFSMATSCTWRLRSEVESDRFSIKTAILSCMEELPEDEIEAMKTIERKYNELTASLPVPYTVEDYLPSRRMNFLKQYNVRVAKCLTKFVKNERRNIAMRKKYGNDPEMLWKKMSPYYDEDKKTVDEFFLVMPVFGKQLINVLRRLYPKTLDASLLTDGNSDYVRTKKIVSIAEEYEKALMMYKTIGYVPKYLDLLKPVLKKMNRLSGEILSFYSKSILP